MQQQYTAKDIERFWGKVDKESSTTFYNGTRCWIWIAGTSKNQYGMFSMRDKPYSAHRVAYELAFGKIPDGLLVLHQCDNRPCVNPAHLVLGTYQENSSDMVGKGRQATGEQCGRTKLTRTQAEEIRQRYGQFGLGESSIALAKEFGISRKQVRNIVRGLFWK